MRADGCVVACYAGVLGFSDFESGMTPWYHNGCSGYGCPTVLTNSEVQQSGGSGYAGGGALKLLGDWNNLFLPTENTVEADPTLTLSLSFDLVVQASWLPVIGLRLDDFNGNQLWITKWYTNLNKWVDPSGNEHACGATSSITDGVAIEFQFTPTMGRMDGYINGEQVCSGYGQVDAAVTYQRWARIRLSMSNKDPVATNAIVDNLQLRTGATSLLPGLAPLRRTLNPVDTRRADAGSLYGGNVR